MGVCENGCVCVCQQLCETAVKSMVWQAMSACSNGSQTMLGVYAKCLATPACGYAVCMYECGTERYPGGGTKWLKPSLPSYRGHCVGAAGMMSVEIELTASLVWHTAALPLGEPP